MAVLLAAVLFLGPAGCQRTPAAPEKVGIGKPAPTFSLETLDGGRVALPNLQGKVVLIDFWATWCPPCRDSLERLNEFHARHLESDLEIVAISVDTSPDRVRAFVAEHGLNLTVALDDGTAAERYGVGEIPAVFLLDRTGTLVHWAVGYSKSLEARIEGWIEELL